MTLGGLACSRWVNCVDSVVASSPEAPPASALRTCGSGKPIGNSRCSRTTAGRTAISLGDTSMVEKISAVTLRVANMQTSVRFYKDVLGLEIIYGGEGSYFTSLRTKDGDTILNLEHGNAGIRWGRLIFHVSDVDRFRGVPHGKRLSSRQSAGCLVGRTLFPYARS